MNSHHIKSKWDLDLDLFEMILKGQSPVDTHTPLQKMLSRTDVDLFLKYYGYDLNHPIEQAELMGHFREALHFIRHYFLYPANPEGLKIEIPSSILTLNEAQDLFLMKNPTDRLWACSLLKVIHVIAHVDKELSSSYFSDIQKQVFDRFYKHIYRTDDGELFLGLSQTDLYKVPLVAFETKPKKSRESIILKMLHKTDHVTEAIFDRVGIRFVAHSTFDCLSVLQYLCDHHILIPFNLKPSRSKNTLVYLKKWKLKYHMLYKKMKKGKLTESSFLEELSFFSKKSEPTSLSENPHSSESYKAIQLTGSILIKLKNSIFEELTEIKNLEKNYSIPEEVQKKINRIDLKSISKEIRFFYPFEVQIIDKENFEESKVGTSAHSHYKKAQIFTAMKRVMGQLAST